VQAFGTATSGTETIMSQYLAITPLFIIFTGAVLIVLISLTMRAVIRREKAMIRAELETPNQVAAYEARWRTTSRELASDSAAALASVLPSNRSAA
jgi:hypothetical protein